MLQDAFDKGMQRKTKVVLKGRLKETNHFRHLDDIRSERIEAPNMNTKGGPVARGEGLYKRGLDLTSLLLRRFAQQASNSQNRQGT